MNESGKDDIMRSLSEIEARLTNRMGAVSANDRNYVKEAKSNEIKNSKKELLYSTGGNNVRDIQVRENCKLPQLTLK